MDLVKKIFHITDVKQGDADLTIDAIISTEDIDRDGDVVVQKGINFDKFLKNPIVLLNHIPSKAIGGVRNIRQSENTTEATIEFATKEESAEGYSVGKLYKSRKMNAFSIAFKNKKDIIKNGVRYLLETELVEVSAVAIGANPYAVQKSFEDGEITEMEYKTFNKALTKDTTYTYIEDMIDSKTDVKDDSQLDTELKALKEQNSSLIKTVEAQADTIKGLSTLQKSDEDTAEEEASEKTEASDTTENGDSTEDNKESGNTEDADNSFGDTDDEKAYVLNGLKKDFKEGV